MEIIDDNFCDSKKENEFKYRGAVIWAVVLIVGVTFKFLRWPGGLFFCVISSAGLSAYCFYYFIKLKGSNQLNNFLSLICLIWTVYLLAGIFLEDISFVNEKGVGVYLLVLLVYFFIYFGLNNYRNEWKNRYKS